MNRKPKSRKTKREPIVLGHRKPEEKNLSIHEEWRYIAAWGTIIVNKLVSCREETTTTNGDDDVENEK